ncbi:aminotransferase class I/II-fold pyridoxal phosphate-dependent enzyme, partial [Pseudomonadota bacterium]
LREGFESLGFNVGRTRTPIVPIVVGDEKIALLMWRKLFDQGVFSSPVFSPGVPLGKALIRTSCMATHNDTQIDQVLDTFGRIGRSLGLC